MLNSEFPMPIRGSRSYELVGPRIGGLVRSPSCGVQPSALAHRTHQLQIHYLAIRFWVIDSRHE